MNRMIRMRPVHYKILTMSTTLTRSTALTRAIDYRLLTISSPAFSDGSRIPNKYTCDGENINPPLHIQDIPTEATSLAIIVDDPDAPIGTWSHWLTWNIPITHTVRENHQHGEEGLNDFLENRYDGPCPHAGLHHYHFKVYALDAQMILPGRTRQRDLEKAMAGHILAYGELIGTYKRKGS
jgi:Raf kinase inhibitor-like YbhB/YbcL family protein